MDKQKIMIVDDDNSIAELISLYLIKECFETSIVNDGEEALRLCARFLRIISFTTGTALFSGTANMTSGS